MEQGGRGEHPMVEIIMPVYNGPHHLRRCVDLLYRHTDSEAFHLILIDDGSDRYTKQALAEIAAARPNVSLLAQETNQGFIAAVNRGLAASNAEHLVLLNIDVLVTPGWLSRLLAAAASDPRVGLVCPLSNNAENLSVTMPRGYSFNRTAALIAERSERRYPDIVTVVDYCMYVSRRVLDAIGPYDPVYRPVFVEEADYQYRALAAGFRAVAADDCYVFHYGGASKAAWTPARTRNLEIFRARWGARFLADLARWAADDALGALRDARTLTIPDPPPPEYDVVFFLPMAVAGVGGMISVVELTNRLIQQGYRATVAHAGPWGIDVECLFTPLSYETEADFLSYPPRTKVLVATAFQTVAAVVAVCDRYGCEPAYFIQDYEGYFDGGANLSAAAATYARIPNRIVVSEWVRGLLAEQHGLDATVIPLGVDVDECYPRAVSLPALDALRAGRCVVFVVLRDDDRRGAPYILEAIRLLEWECPALLFACAGHLAPPARPNTASLGVLDRPALARHLAAADIALDASDYHGFGMLGIEAMASGTAAVLTDSGGCREYAEHERNCLLIPPRDARGLADALKRLQANPDLRARLGAAGRDTALRFDWDCLAARHAAFYAPLIARARLDEERYARVGRYEPQGPSEAPVTTIYRAFDGRDHLYTADPDEAMQSGYVVEGPAFAVYAEPAPDRLPFHRLCQSRTGDHLYTVDPGEGSPAGYRDEGVIGFVARRDDPGLLPLYRGYHPRMGDHLYSLDAAECAHAGYRPEGIAGWTPPLQSGSRNVPPSAGGHTAPGSGACVSGPRRRARWPLRRQVRRASFLVDGLGRLVRGRRRR